MSRETVIERAVEGPGKASREQRRAAFANAGVAPEAVRALIDKVAKHAYKVTDEDVAAAKSAGLAEDQIFELVVCAALGQAKRQLDNALAALAEAT
jgi:alkylhydroperoxidase family enzyme